MSADAIERIATAYRLRLEDDLDYAEDPHCMVGECRTASHELAAALVAAGYPARARFGTYHGISEDYADLVQGRAPEPLDTGDEDGTWRHWYVVCGELVVDVTADQFHPDDPDHPRVIVTGVDDERYAGAGHARRPGR